MSEHQHQFETIQIHEGHSPDKDTNSRAVPLYQTTSFTFNSAEHGAKLFGLKELGNIYTRIGNPTTHVLESRMSQLEGGHPLAAVATASGTSAVFYSIINLAQAGDNIVSSNKLYGGTYTQFNDSLPTLGITVRFVDMNDPENIRASVDDKTRAVFCESVSNPALEICDLEAISKVAHDYNMQASPLRQTGHRLRRSPMGPRPPRDRRAPRVQAPHAHRRASQHRSCPVPR